MEAALTSKGQATIPKPIRDHLGLKPGDKVKFLIQPDGRVALLPKVPMSRLRGMIKSKVPRVSLEDMDAAIAEGAARLPLRHEGK